jgi:hypothetical protein
VSRGSRPAVAGLVIAGVLCAAALVLFASGACPTDLPAQPCPTAGVNRLVVIGLAAVAVALFAAPFAFLGEFALRRRIVYRGAWGRAARRGILAGAVVGVLAGLRLGGAMSVPGALFILLLAAVLEWFAIRRLDGP